MFVIDLKDVTKDSINLVGGKGANLGELLHAGFPVPEGFCITSHAYNTYIESNNFENIINEYSAKIGAMPKQSVQFAKKMRDIFNAGEIPEDMAQAIRQSYFVLGNNVRVAVRSSATAEDLPEASFAGQQETYLNIIGFDDLMKMVKSCFASLWTERAISYRKQKGFDKHKIALAIVVQQMIESDISGVLFTVNPVNQNRNEMTINASYGLGESVVSGIVTPDTFIWNTKENSIKEKVLGSKEISVVYGTGQHTVQKQNDDAIRGRYCITDLQLKKLVTIAQRIEKHYAFPQDIEWTIKDQNIFILQSRNITTLVATDTALKKKDSKKKQSKLERRVINNMIEHCPNPPYPLELEPLCIISNERAELLYELGIKMRGNLIVLQDNGCIDFNIPTVRLSPRILLIGLKVKQYMNFDANINLTSTTFDVNRKRLKQMERVDFQSLSLEEIILYTKELMGISKELILVRFKYNIYPNILINKLIASRLKKAKLHFNEYDLLSGLQYKTWNMNIALGKIVAYVQGNADLMEKIKTLPIDETVVDNFERIQKEFSAFQNMIIKFLFEFGWKSTNSYLAFSATSWNEDITNLIILIQSSLSVQQEATTTNKYESLCQEIEAFFPPQKADKLHDRIKQIRAYHMNREESLYMTEWCYGLIRMILKEIVRRFPSHFTAYSDILCITLDELYALMDSNVSLNYPKIIEIRKKSLKKNQILWDSMELDTSNAKRDSLKGVPGNFGKVKGIVCIVNNISEFSKLQAGQILVCKYTDPVWTPLFSIAKAVVSDTGGPLSHSAIVAREYGIPAVLGCGNATKILSDGETVVVDGDNGYVNILN